MTGLLFKDRDDLKYYPEGTGQLIIDLKKEDWGRGRVSRKLVCPPWAIFPKPPFKFSHFVALNRKLN